MPPRDKMVYCEDTGELCEYSQYYKTKHWDLLKQQFKKSIYYNGKCSKCKKKIPGLHIHHRHYDSLGKETMSDLKALCPSCHSAVHKIKFKSGNPFKIAMRCWGKEEYGTYQVDEYLESIR